MIYETVRINSTQEATLAYLKAAPRKEQIPLQDLALPEILILTSYPPRECGIATYSQDLLKALNNKFEHSFSLKICALESGKSNLAYPEEVKYKLDTTDTTKFSALAHQINADPTIHLVMVQHEFGFFSNDSADAFLQFLYKLTKPAVVVFHTVLPNPDDALRRHVKNTTAACAAVVVMTQNAGEILRGVYDVPPKRIEVIEHGTHLVPHLNKEILKERFGLSGRKILSTFGLLSSGKSIETTLAGLPAIIAINPDVLFLIIGKTHPSVMTWEGEKYRDSLTAKVEELNLQNHVKFINAYQSLPDLLAYLQLTDIYLFTSKDPNQAVSGTFSYALSCGCPIISTPIPHAKEVLSTNTGILIDFGNAEQLAAGVNRLMSDETLRQSFSESILQRIVPTAWENSAIAHALLVQKIGTQDTITPSVYGDPPPSYRRMMQAAPKITLNYRLPDLNLSHLKKMTTEVGIIQFSKINQPDLESGFTLDDNARALIALCMHYAFTGNETDLPYIRTYLNFIKYCQQPKGDFLNYVDSDLRFTEQNFETNLSDANGRALWALGFLISKQGILPDELVAIAESVLQNALPHIATMHSTRSMAFTLKGLYYANLHQKSDAYTSIIKTLADRLVQMYRHEAEPNWQWYESYLTYGNSVLPEAMLCAYLETGDFTYKAIAKTSFDFLLSQTFFGARIKVISNKTWLQKGQVGAEFGEQPIDIAYTILALKKFYNVFREPNYARKMTAAFNWFLGNNHLHQIIYNPCTGGCYDGLEETHVNLNQGSESTVSYLMARLTMENGL